VSQLRLDPLTGRWVVVSTNRSGRMQAFPAGATTAAPHGVRPCPFCPGNEEETLPALVTYDAGGSWRVRVVPNLFPAFEGTAPMVVSHLGPVFTQAPGSGIHEVLILSPHHGQPWADLPDDQVDLVMEAIVGRVAAHAGTPGLRYSQAIVNSGREAGASVDHPHAQLLGMPFVPRELADEQAGFARFEGSCLLCTTAAAEVDEGHRIVTADDDVVVLCPFWSAAPYEMLVVPHPHGAHVHRAAAATVTAVGRALRDALRRLRACVGEVPYNLVFHSAPYRVAVTFHWHVHVIPKLTTPAGFEFGTGVMVNVVAPEAAAADLAAVAS
jgi:UDPglucose--hexose-1-phosphate uridylyltransferase